VVTPKIARDDIIPHGCQSAGYNPGSRVGSGERDRFTLNLVKGEKIGGGSHRHKSNAVFNVLGPRKKHCPEQKKAGTRGISS
jgi:hypothetical protein